MTKTIVILVRSMSWLLIFALAGCVTAIGLNHDEYCAQQDLVFTSVVDSESSGTSYNGILGGSSGSSSGSAVSCQKPKTKFEKCEVMKYQTFVNMKADWNDKVGTKRLINGTGYVLLIAPGVVAYFIYDSQRADKIHEIQKKMDELKGMCDQYDETDKPKDKT